MTALMLRMQSDAMRLQEMQPQLGVVPPAAPAPQPEAEGALCVVCMDAPRQHIISSHAATSACTCVRRVRSSSHRRRHRPVLCVARSPQRPRACTACACSKAWHRAGVIIMCRVVKHCDQRAWHSQPHAICRWGALCRCHSLVAAVQV